MKLGTVEIKIVLYPIVCSDPEFSVVRNAQILAPTADNATRATDISYVNRFANGSVLNENKQFVGIVRRVLRTDGSRNNRAVFRYEEGSQPIRNLDRPLPRL